MKKQAFTLAEVLITLVIIGVIAALTIPTLINKNNDDIYVASLKKFYSTTNQLLQKVALDDCGTPGNIGCFSTAEEMELAIAKHYKIAKSCDYDTNENCWATINSHFDGSGPTFDPDTDNGDYLSFITLDGMSVQVKISNPSCAFLGGGNAQSPMYKTCGEVIVDVNGLKPPNRAGKDVFTFEITSNLAPLLYPNGGKDFDYWQYNETCKFSNPVGTRCSGRIMDQNWVMDYSDYGGSPPPDPI